VSLMFSFWPWHSTILAEIEIPSGIEMSNALRVCFNYNINNTK
jgi:hypothetical protein